MNNHCTVDIPWHSQTHLLQYGTSDTWSQHDWPYDRCQVRRASHAAVTACYHISLWLQRTEISLRQAELWVHHRKLEPWRPICRFPQSQSIWYERTDKFMLQLSGESDRMKVKLFLMFLSFMHLVLSRHVSNVSDQWSSPRKHQIYNSTKHWGGLDTYQWYEDNEPPSLIKEQKLRSIGKMIKLLPDSLFSTLAASIVLNKLQNDWYDALRSAGWLTLLTLTLHML